MEGRKCGLLQNPAKHLWPQHSKPLSCVALVAHPNFCLVPIRPPLRAWRTCVWWISQSEAAAAYSRQTARRGTPALLATACLPPASGWERRRLQVGTSWAARRLVPDSRAGRGAGRRGPHRRRPAMGRCTVRLDAHSGDALEPLRTAWQSAAALVILRACWCY